MGRIVKKNFYNRETTKVARELLGKKLVRMFANGTKREGIIVEAEAYTGVGDLASHGKVKVTKRNAVMWGEPGHAYVYLIYGMYWMLNIVTEKKDYPAAVLIRSIELLDEVHALANGPGKVARAFGIEKSLNGVDITTEESMLWIEEELTVVSRDIACGPRVGLGKVPEPWLSKPWRFWIRGNKHVSKSR